jgi:hypothetical protein
VPYSRFKKALDDEFAPKVLPEPLLLSLFQRFCQFQFKKGSEGTELASEMDVADFMLGITLLSRIPHDSKIRCES